MSNPNWNHAPEFTLHVDREMIIYEDGEEDPEAIFYHKADDPSGCVLEAKQRRAIRAYLEESALFNLIQDKGDTVKDGIFPVANTTNVLGILKGDVEFSPTYKRLMDVTREDIGLHLEFARNLANLERDELARMEAYGWAN
jgi:hypothetical protein